MSLPKIAATVLERPLAFMPSPISIQAATRRFGSTLALDAVDLDIAPGEFVALLGPSGCGKTTLLRLVADLDAPSTGQVLIDGAPPRAARKAHRLGLVSQRPAVLPWLSAQGDVDFTRRIVRAARGLPASALLEAFGLGAHVARRPAQLSGGMVQRVNFASAIAHEPDILLMDEPFSALDEMKREELGQWLTDQLARSPKTVLFVTHHIDEAILLADRIVVMSASPGQVVDIVIPGVPRPRTLDFRASEAFSQLSLRIRQRLFATEAA